MEIVHDVDRPDIGGTPPKMQEVVHKFEDALMGLVDNKTLSVLKVSTNDNLMSSVLIVGSYDPKEDWQSKCFENSKHFKIHISTEKDIRYYAPGLKVTVELLTSHKCGKLRKSTNTVEKTVKRVKNWIIDNKQLSG